MAYSFIDVLVTSFFIEKKSKHLSLKTIKLRIWQVYTVCKTVQYSYKWNVDVQQTPVCNNWIFTGSGSVAHRWSFNFFRPRVRRSYSLQTLLMLIKACDAMVRSAFQVSRKPTCMNCRGDLIFPVLTPDDFNETVVKISFLHSKQKKRVYNRGRGVRDYTLLEHLRHFNAWDLLFKLH